MTPIAEKWEAPIKNVVKQSVAQTGLLDFAGHQDDIHVLESEFCKDFTCCGLKLGDMHELLQHYELCHVMLEESTESSNNNWSARDYDSMSGDSDGLFRRRRANSCSQMDEYAAVGSNGELILGGEGSVVHPRDDCEIYDHYLASGEIPDGSQFIAEYVDVVGGSGVSL